MGRSAFEIQKAVVFALFVRELKTRYGKYRLGYVWALVEPMMHVSILAGIWTLMGRTEFSGVPVPLFLATGFVPFFFFRSVATQSMNAIDANRGLFNYRQVRPIDPVLARIALEALLYTAVYVALLFVGGWFLGYDVAIHDPLQLLLTNGILFLMSCGVALLMAVYGTLYPEVLKVLPATVFRALYFTSGLMFPLAIVPAEYHEWLLWNPVLHLIELNHASYFYAFEAPPGVNLVYPALFGLSALALGLLSYRSNWVRMVAT